MQHQPGFLRRRGPLPGRGVIFVAVVCGLLAIFLILPHALSIRLFWLSVVALAVGYVVYLLRVRLHPGRSVIFVAIVCGLLAIFLILPHALSIRLFWLSVVALPVGYVVYRLRTRLARGATSLVGGMVRLRDLLSSGVARLNILLVNGAAWLGSLLLVGIAGLGDRLWAMRRAGGRSRRFGRAMYHALAVISINFMIVVLLLPVVEWGLRRYFDEYGSEEQRIKYVYSAQHIADLKSQFVGQPYTVFGNSPYWSGHNALGYRAEYEIEVPKPPDRFRIVALGGSTTYGYLIPNGLTYPDDLQRLLGDEYHYHDVEVINAGVQVYTTWETLANLEFRVLELQPDMIIIYHAHNDITARLIQPEYYRSDQPSRGVWRTEPQQLPKSVIQRIVWLKLGWMEDPTAVEAQFEFVGETPPVCDQFTDKECGGYPVEELMRLNPPIYYDRNLRSIAAIAHANGIQVLFVSFGYYPEEFDGTNIYSWPWRQEAMAEHNAILEQVASDTGNPFCDLFNLIPYDQSFWRHDGYHYTTEGSQMQAEVIGQCIVDQGLIPTQFALGSE